LALNCSKECWLPHKSEEAAMRLCITRYTACNSRLQYLTYKDVIELRGFYDCDGAGRIRCLALTQPDSDDWLFIDAPDPAPDINWTFANNICADARLVHPDGDNIVLLKRFASKYPRDFGPLATTPINSFEADGESPHSSLGVVRRGSESKGSGKSKNKCKTKTGSKTNGSVAVGAATPAGASLAAASGVAPVDEPAIEGNASAPPAREPS
jgi:hypothetical protein